MNSKFSLEVQREMFLDGLYLVAEKKIINIA